MSKNNVKDVSFGRRVKFHIRVKIRVVRWKQICRIAFVVDRFYLVRLFIIYFLRVHKTRFLQTTLVDLTSLRAQTSDVSRERGCATATTIVETAATRKIANRSPVVRQNSPAPRIIA